MVKTVMVVEDNPSHQALYTLELEDEGYRVVVVEDIEAALDMIRQARPDVVIMDVHTPRDPQAGLAALAALRALDADLPVILHSAYTDCRDAQLSGRATALGRRGRCITGGHSYRSRVGTASRGVRTRMHSRRLPPRMNGGPDHVYDA